MFDENICFDPSFWRKADDGGECFLPLWAQRNKLPNNRYYLSSWDAAHVEGVYSVEQLSTICRPKICREVAVYTSFDAVQRVRKAQASSGHNYLEALGVGILSNVGAAVFPFVEFHGKSYLCMSLRVDEETNTAKSSTFNCYTNSLDQPLCNKDGVAYSTVMGSALINLTREFCLFNRQNGLQVGIAIDGKLYQPNFKGDISGVVDATICSLAELNIPWLNVSPVEFHHSTRHASIGEDGEVVIKKYPEPLVETLYVFYDAYWHNFQVAIGVKLQLDENHILCYCEPTGHAGSIYNVLYSGQGLLGRRQCRCVLLDLDSGELFLPNCSAETGLCNVGRVLSPKKGLAGGVDLNHEFKKLYYAFEASESFCTERCPDTGFAYADGSKKLRVAVA